MKDNKTTTTGGVSFTGLLTLLFIGLKLGGVIDWAWVWVLSPLWISLAVTVVILLIVIVVSILKLK